METRSHLDVRESQWLDRQTIERYGIPSIILMENAGRQTAEVIRKQLFGQRSTKVAVVCGTGNNGGDGFVVARHLGEAGMEVRTFLLGEALKLKPEAWLNYDILNRLSYPVQVGGTLPDLGGFDVVVDALFGVGLNRTLDPVFAGVISRINQESRQVISVDIPSGLDGTSGMIYGACVRAKITVSFTAPKTGFFQGEGPRYVGTVEVVNIGIPRVLTRKIFDGRAL